MVTNADHTHLAVHRLVFRVKFQEPHLQTLTEIPTVETLNANTLIDSTSRAQRVTLNPGHGWKILRSHILLLFPISQAWTHRLSTGGFAILPIKQKLCSEQHLCILGAIMHISNKKGVENLAFFKMSILVSPDVSSNDHLLFLYIYGLSLQSSILIFTL